MTAGFQGAAPACGRPTVGFVTGGLLAGVGYGMDKLLNTVGFYDLFGPGPIGDGPFGKAPGAATVGEAGTGLESGATDDLAASNVKEADSSWRDENGDSNWINVSVNSSHCQL